MASSYARSVATARPSPSGRSKRLTLDLTPELHRALKVRAAELEVPMVDLLRGFLADALDDPETLTALAARMRESKHASEEVGPKR